MHERKINVVHLLSALIIPPFHHLWNPHQGIHTGHPHQFLPPHLEEACSCLQPSHAQGRYRQPQSESQKHSTTIHLLLLSAAAGGAAKTRLSLHLLVGSISRAWWALFRTHSSCDMEEPSPSGSGHPYLPGTASLVQEIDSKFC